MELRKILPAFIVHVQYHHYRRSLKYSCKPQIRTQLFPVFCAHLPCVVYTYVFSSDVGHKAELSGMFFYESNLL